MPSLIVRVSDQFLKIAKFAARLDKRTLSNWVRCAIEEKIERQAPELLKRDTIEADNPDSR